MIYSGFLTKTYHPKGCLEFMLKILEFTTLKDLYERIRTKFSAKKTKQTQFLWVFCLETAIPLENKANSKLNQNLSSIGAYLLFCRGANFGLKIRGQSQFKPKNKFILDCCLLTFLSGTQN